MMGLYIKGMEMPTYCAECPLCSLETLDCMAGGTRDKNAFDGVYANCPLVPVPPHGRLIDAKYVRDTIIQEWMDKADDSHMYKRGMEDAYEVIRNAPTIIQAEEGE